MKRFTRVSLLFVLNFVILAATAEGADYYTTNSWSQFNQSVLAPGDTLHLVGTNYDSGVETSGEYGVATNRLYITASGAAGNPVVFTNYVSPYP